MATTTRVIRSERFPDLADEVLFPRCSDGKMEWLAKHGARQTFQTGETLYEHAVREAPFYVIDRGLVEFIDRKPGKDVHVAQADSRTFIGDIAIFTGEPTISACVAVEPTDVIVFDRAALRGMVARWPEFGEHVFRTLMARRAWHEAEGHGVMRLIAARGSRRAFDVRDLLERNLLPVRWYDVDTDDESAALLEQVADVERAPRAARGDQAHDAVALGLVPRPPRQQRAEDVLAELGPAREHVAQAALVEGDHLGHLDRDARADRRFPGERRDVADERAAVGLRDVDVLARLAVDELDAALVDDVERRVADGVLVEHLAGLEGAPLAALGEPRQLGV